ncbi:class I SAM-dependent methyltransferase [Campylobacter sp. RM16190]|uniref:class I SAM-dependent methyltransferase n=1 Tax=Campylobacter sp. RM16190 TaxID=1705727 RepID=UPI0014741294|nr:class I SAM-dependent methyltransferase [Campylobacter sp. RM16190]
MDKGFYVAFENRFRGSEELIKERQKKYLKFINPLKEIKNEVNVLDIGCGRGEWLDLLLENGFKAKGIDIDDDMIELSLGKGFDVEKSDAISKLKSLGDNSIDIITAFQVVEHMEFSDVLEICKEAMRVLSPCGILILETPNPENIMVSTQLFYLDTTHKKPIPCELLAFTTEYCGFERNFIFKTNEKEFTRYKFNVTIFDVFEGVSPDYAIIAQKNGEQKNIFDEAFIVSAGVNLAQISKSYMDTIRLYNEHNEYAQRYMQLKEDFDGMKRSKSWRITKPLRIFTNFAKKVIRRLKRYKSQLVGSCVKMPISNGVDANLTKQELEIYNRLKR